MKKCFKLAQVKEIDAFTISNEPISSLDLMERAAQTMFESLQKDMFCNIPFVFLIGPGNNGGDGLAMARLMKQAGLEVQALLIKVSNKLSPDCLYNLNRLKAENVFVKNIKSIDDFPEIHTNALIIDAIFGAGLNRSIHGLAADIIHEVNQLPNRKLAIDAPSGLFGEDNTNNDGAIFKANYSYAIQFPSLSFLFHENEKFVGLWKIIDIKLHPDAIESTDTSWFLLEKDDVVSRLKPRANFSHKGSYGHALLIAGAYQKMGAAVLAAKACLKTGVGLLTCHIPKLGYQIMQISAPEAMVSIDQSDLIFSDVSNIEKYSAIGIGPGIGEKPNTVLAMRKLLELINVPIVLDADALNIIAKNPELLDEIPKHSILTPHPKEFDRLFGASGNSYQRLVQLANYAKQYEIVIVLKGAYTRIALPNGDILFNQTGNSGMATGGSGDVLTGMILSFLAQKYSPVDAAIIAVYLHGAAGDLYVQKYAAESLIAGDLINNFGTVLKKIKE